MNRLQLLKTLAPGFLPLLVYVIADSIWGTRIGLLIALLTGLVQLVMHYAIERKLDRFILFDLLLLLVLGALSLALENPLLFKLKPALIGVLFCALLGLSVFSRHNLLRLLSARYLEKFALSEQQWAEMTAALRPLFYLFSLHTLLVFYAALALSREAWAFISGGLFYLIFFAFMAWEWLRRRQEQKKVLREHATEEWFDLVDPEGRVLGKAPRSLCHSGRGRLHPVVHLHVLSSDGRLLLQQRAPWREIQPGRWDTAVGGHVRSGESVEAALKRETAEEIGRSDLKYRFLARYVWESERESELVYLFLARAEGNFTYDRNEISDLRFWRAKKIRKNLEKGIFTENFRLEFDLLDRTVFRSGVVPG